MSKDPDEDISIAEIRTQDAGTDPNNPYESVDIAGLPEWWQRLIHEFEASDLRTYQPPRFDDGTLKHEIVDFLEREYDIDIRFSGVNVSYGDDWTAFVDNEAVCEISRRRDPAGYTVYEIDSDEFETRIKRYLDR
jgi:hypothetical protein